jgi:tRNA(fMet)-specific endonuclease VapC
MTPRERSCRVYVLDTNTLIYFFKGIGGVADRLLSTPPSEVAVPAVVVFELELGIAKSSAPGRRRKQLDQLLSAITILPFGQSEARIAARVRARLEAAGTPIGPLDTLIAGTAVAANGILVTHNTAEFSRVEQLTVEDWY